MAAAVVGQQVQFEIPVSYPTTPFEIVLPEIDGKTSKVRQRLRLQACPSCRRVAAHSMRHRCRQMYRGGKICLSVHFKPLWAKNVPHFGIAHALALGLAPWLAAEVPHLIDTGAIGEKKH